MINRFWIRRRVKKRAEGELSAKVVVSKKTRIKKTTMGLRRNCLREKGQMRTPTIQKSRKRVSKRIMMMMIMVCCNMGRRISFTDLIF
jgi:hypothetical protein